MLSDSKYVAMLSQIYEKQWFDDSHFGDACNLIVKYHAKTGKVPKFATVDLYANKLYPDDYQEIRAKIQAANSISLDEYDRETLDEEVTTYLRDKGLYWAIISDIDAISEKHSVAGMIDKITKLTAMSFDQDIGLDYFEDIDEHCEQVANPENTISTGWDTVDEYMNGGLLRDGRCLAVFMGQTHIGKSLMLSNLAANMIRNNKFAIIYSLEMSELVYGKRIDAHLTKGDINQLQYNVDDIKRQAEVIKSGCPEAKLVIKEFPPDSITCNNIKSHLDRVISIHGRLPDVIIIDYINLLLPETKGERGENSYNKYKTVATEMRRLSYQIPRPVVSVTQVNRGGFNSTDIDMSDTSDSMGIPMTADFVGMMYQNEGDREAELLNVKVEKNRLGGRIGKTLQFHVDYRNLTISDIDTRLQTPESLVNDVIDDIGEL